MVCSKTVQFLKPGFVKKLLWVTVQAEWTMLSDPICSFGVITIRFALAQTPELTNQEQTRTRNWITSFGLTNWHCCCIWCDGHAGRTLLSRNDWHRTGEERKIYWHKRIGNKTMRTTTDKRLEWKVSKTGTVLEWSLISAARCQNGAGCVNKTTAGGRTQDADQWNRDP